MCSQTCPWLSREPTWPSLPGSIGHQLLCLQSVVTTKGWVEDRCDGFTEYRCEFGERCNISMGVGAGLRKNSWVDFPLAKKIEEKKPYVKN